MLKAVFFDVGNTLLAPFPSVSEVVRQVLADEGHLRDLSAIDALLPLVDEYYEDRYRTDDTFWTSEQETSQVWVGMYSLLCRRLGIDLDAERIALRVYDEFGSADRWRAYEDVEPAFERLSSAGLALGLISNWDRRLGGLIEGLGLSRHLDVIISSAHVGLHKPDPRIFELACERVGVAPSEAAHVGDHHYADVLGAMSVGMTPVLIDRHGLPVPPEAPERVLTTLDDLEAVLGLEG
ncbi:MAG: HAD-IA family hydrolase [Coriobacteriia bacterium]|nr:HAD-IA family hydrolase [Coriobacteriia bacterium]